MERQSYVATFKSINPKSSVKMSCWRMEDYLLAEKYTVYKYAYLNVHCVYTQCTKWSIIFEIYVTPISYHVNSCQATFI